MASKAFDFFVTIFEIMMEAVHYVHTFLDLGNSETWEIIALNVFAGLILLAIIDFFASLRSFQFVRAAALAFVMIVAITLISLMDRNQMRPGDMFYHEQGPIVVAEFELNSPTSELLISIANLMMLV